MIKENHPSKDIDKFKDALKHYHEWIPHENLPKDWLYKVSKNDTVSFISNIGQFFKSKIQALVHLKKENFIDEYDLIKEFDLAPKKVKTQSLRTIDESWIQNSPLVH